MESGNPVLDNNLKCIEKYNKQLCEKLLSLQYIKHKIELAETELKEPNLIYDETFLHNEKGAEIEAQKIIPQKVKGINVVFGFGIGYLFRQACEKTDGFVIVYEPNLEILRVTLELVDFTSELSMKNVFLTSDFEEFSQIFEKIYKIEAEVFVLYLDSYKFLFLNELSSMIKKVEMLRAKIKECYDALHKTGYIFILSAMQNFASSLKATPLLELKDLYKGKTALVVSAGPTLDRNIELIKKNEDKFVIFSVGTALKALLQNGIIPDFVNNVEFKDTSGQFVGFDLSQINLIVAPYTNSAVQNLNVKKRFIFPSSTTRGGQYWSHLTGIKISECVTNGTVAAAALASAKMLGAKRIILVGQDLAFVNNACYSKNSAYQGLVFEINKETGKPEYRIEDYDVFMKSYFPIGVDITQDWCREEADSKLKNMNSITHYVKGITGEMLPTLVGYAMFVDIFKDFATKNQDLDLINTSMLGAQIDGFKNIPLEDVIDDLPKINKHLPVKTYKYDINYILKKLDEDKALLGGVFDLLQNMKDYIRKIEKDVRNRRLLPDASDSYKPLIITYDKINVKYFDKSLFFQTLISGENYKIQNYFKTTTDAGSSKNKRLYELLKEYVSPVENKVLEISAEIDRQKEIILNERFDTES